MKMVYLVRNFCVTFYKAKVCNEICFIFSNILLSSKIVMKYVFILYELSIDELRE